MSRGPVVCDSTSLHLLFLTGKTTASYLVPVKNHSQSKTAQWLVDHPVECEKGLGVIIIHIHFHLKKYDRAQLEICTTTLVIKGDNRGSWNIKKMKFRWWNGEKHWFILISSKSWSEIDEIKIHQCFSPSHRTKCHFFGVFRIKNIMFDDVLVPWGTGFFWFKIDYIVVIS